MRTVVFIVSCMTGFDDFPVTFDDFPGTFRDISPTFDDTSVTFDEKSKTFRDFSKQPSHVFTHLTNFILHEATPELNPQKTPAHQPTSKWYGNRGPYIHIILLTLRYAPSQRHVFQHSLFLLPFLLQ